LSAGRSAAHSTCSSSLSNWSSICWSSAESDLCWARCCRSSRRRCLSSVHICRLPSHPHYPSSEEPSTEGGEVRSVSLGPGATPMPWKGAGGRGGLDSTGQLRFIDDIDIRLDGARRRGKCMDGVSALMVAEETVFEDDSQVDGARRHIGPVGVAALGVIGAHAPGESGPEGTDKPAQDRIRQFAVPCMTS